MGDIMGGMLIGGTGIILSQAQCYDNQLLLALIYPEGERAARDDRLNFLNLVSDGFIRVGLLENGPDADPPDGERYTLMNMFRTSLAKPSFVLSGWPELNDNLDLRRAVLDCLKRNSGKHMSSEIPANVQARIQGLRELDQILRTSPGGIKIVRLAEGSLEVRIQNALQMMEPDDNAVRRAAANVTEIAARDNISLSTRSSWYRLIDLVQRYSSSAEDSALSMIRDMVDLNYNAMVSESLRDEGMSLSAGYENIADTAAHEFTPGLSPGKRWADLNPTQNKGNWLRWSDMPYLLDRLRSLSPEGRLNELEQYRSEQIAKWEKSHYWGVSIKIALPIAASSAITNASAVPVTGATPGQAAGVGGLFGAATLMAGTPVVRALKKKRTDQLEERLMLDERSAVRARAAGWLERMRRH